MLQKIRQLAEQHPQKIAYRSGDQQLTYQELWTLANDAAELLKRQGNAPVMLYGHKEPFMVIGMLACLLAHRTYVPVDISTPRLRIESIAARTEISLILSDQMIDVGQADCCSLSDLQRYADSEVCGCTSDIAYIIFTSGSTGEPKGVPISRGNLSNFAAWICSLHPLSEYKDSVVMNQASFSFDLSVADVYYALCSGHTLVACDRAAQEDYDRVFDLMQSEQVNITVTTPTFYKLCLTNHEFCAEQFPHLRCAYFCGECLENKTAKKLLERFPNLRIINAYGPTEATSAVSGVLIDAKTVAEEELLPVGDASQFATEISVRDGEIVLKGESVFGGYLDGMQGGYFTEDGVNCYRTGDLGFLQDGKLYCKGRRDSQVKFKGYRIELSEIEQNILRLQGVRDCVVTAKRNEQDIVKTIQAFVLAEPTVTVDSIRAELARTLPAYMIPKTIRILDRFPVNPNGKTDRKALGA